LAGRRLRSPALTAVLDTHVWLWWLQPESPLPAPDRDALDAIAAAKGLYLPAICMWEAQVLHSKGRIELPVPFATWLRRSTASDLLTMLPLGVDTVAEVDALPASFHGDPADRMIVATARVHEMPLATYDKAIRKSRLVRIWRR
jgi:PIN domain nuclease of toxin-antitoxin system